MGDIDSRAQAFLRFFQNVLKLAYLFELLYVAEGVVNGGVIEFDRDGVTLSLESGREFHEVECKIDRR